MNRILEENHILKFQLQQYRDRLQETEILLEKIQKSVDREQRQWLSDLSASQQECDMLKLDVSKLSFQMEELKTSKVKGDPNLRMENEYLKVQLKEAIKKVNETQRARFIENEGLKQVLIVRDKHRNDWQEGHDIAAKLDKRKSTKDETAESTESLFLQCSDSNKSAKEDVVSLTEQLDIHIDELISLERRDDLTIPRITKNIAAEEVMYASCNKEVKDDIVSKEGEDQRISSGLVGISLPLNEISNIGQSQTEASSRKLMTSKDVTRDLDDLKVQNEDKEEEQEQMYAFYQIQIETLKQEIRDLQVKEVKEAANKDKADENDLRKAAAELKKKEDDIHRLMQVNERLKDAVEDTQEIMTQKEEQYQSEIGKINLEIQRLLHVIKNLEVKIQRNIEEIENRKNKDEINNGLENETSKEVILLTSTEERMRLIDQLTSVMAPNGSSHCLGEERKVVVTKDDGYSKVYVNLENEIRILREHNFHLTRAFDDKEKELIAVKRTVARMEESAASFKTEIRTLRLRLDERVNPPMGNEHFIQLEEIIKELRRNNEDNQIEIEGRKVNESSLLKTLTEQMQKKALHDDLLIKYEDLSGANTHLEYIIHDLKREISEKGSEIDDLKREKASLMTKATPKDQDASSECDLVEEDIITKKVELDLSESREVGSEMNKLTEEISGLRVELRSKEDQIGSLRVNLIMQTGENESLGKKLAIKNRLIGCISSLIEEAVRSEINEPRVTWVAVARSGSCLEEEDQEDLQMDDIF